MPLQTLMVLKMDKDTFLKQLNEEFSKFCVRTKSLCDSFEKETNLLKSNNENLSDLIEKSKKQQDLLTKKEIDLNIKIEETDKINRNLLSDQNILKKEIVSVEEKTRILDDRSNKIDEESKQLGLEKTELLEREKWCEMEERRLKYLEKKYNLITQDKEISRKLKELG